MKCSRCQVSHACHELRPYPPEEGKAMCLDCTHKMLVDSLEGCRAEIITAKIITMTLPEHHYFNQGLDRALEIVKRYQRGEGTFQTVDKPKT